jgi:hypothetical protein
LENKEKLINYINHEISILKWINMDGLVPSHIDLPLDRTSYPLNIYMRFFIPYFMDENYANYPEQYGLNVMLVNQWLVLDKKWNHLAISSIVIYR